MDLLDTSTTPFRINDRERRVFSRSSGKPPHYTAKDATVENSIVTDGCQIYGTVKNSVLSPGVIVEEGAEVLDSVIMADTVIRRNAAVCYSILDSGVEVGEDATVGAPKEVSPGITLIGANVKIGVGETVPANVIRTENEVSKA